MIKERFRFLEHTADVKFEVFGETKEELFGNCARAMTAVMTDDDIQRKEEQSIDIAANGDQAQLFDFLTEVILLLEEKKFIVAAVEDMTIDEGRLSARLIGDSISTYDVHGSVKAVTYNDMMIEQRHGIWRAVVVLDV